MRTLLDIYFGIALLMMGYLIGDEIDLTRKKETDHE
jgi:hypothetical protein